MRSQIHHQTSRISFNLDRWRRLMDAADETVEAARRVVLLACVTVVLLLICLICQSFENRRLEIEIKALEAEIQMLRQPQSIQQQ